MKDSEEEAGKREHETHYAPSWAYAPRLIYLASFQKAKGENMKKLSLVSLILVMSLIVFGSLQSRSSGPPFSNGTLSGAYVFSGSGGHPSDATGIANFDGAGNGTGTIFVNHAGETPAQCSGSFSGTYSIDSTGALAMTLTGPGEDCTANTTANFVGETAHNGHAFVFASSDIGHARAGVGVEQ